MLSKQDYIDCYRAMDGVNIVGIVRSFHEALLKMNDLDSKGKNKHPITLCYIDKLTQLTGDCWNANFDDDVLNAYTTVREAASESIPK